MSQLQSGAQWIDNVIFHNEDYVYSYHCRQPNSEHEIICETTIL